MNLIIIGAIIGGIIGLVISIPLIMKQKKINKGDGKARQGKRFIKLVNFSGDSYKIGEKIDNVLAANGYVSHKYGEEMVYRNGSGMATAGKFFKYTIKPDGILIEAFVILFGVQESNLEGFTGIVSKKPLKKMVNEIIFMIVSEK